VEARIVTAGRGIGARIARRAEGMVRQGGTPSPCGHHDVGGEGARASQGWADFFPGAGMAGGGR
jgi:hypothetical protein